MTTLVKHMLLPMRTSVFNSRFPLIPNHIYSGVILYNVHSLWHITDNIIYFGSVVIHIYGPKFTYRHICSLLPCHDKVHCFVLETISFCKNTIWCIKCLSSKVELPFQNNHHLNSTPMYTYNFLRLINATPMYYIIWLISFPSSPLRKRMQPTTCSPDTEASTINARIKLYLQNQLTLLNPIFTDTPLKLSCSGPNTLLLLLHYTVVAWATNVGVVFFFHWGNSAVDNFFLSESKACMGQLKCYHFFSSMGYSLLCLAIVTCHKCCFERVM